jgi:hypothetical protein
MVTVMIFVSPLKIPSTPCPITPSPSRERVGVRV